VGQGGDQAKAPPTIRFGRWLGGTGLGGAYELPVASGAGNVDPDQMVSPTNRDLLRFNDHLRLQGENLASRRANGTALTAR
jgi:hypothetical protein